MTNTLADHIVLVSMFFTVTFLFDENRKVKIYPCGSTCMYKQHFTYPRELTHFSGKISRCTLAGSPVSLSQTRAGVLEFNESKMEQLAEASEKYSSIEGMLCYENI